MKKSFILLFCALIGVLNVMARQAYAVFNNNTLIFYYDNLKNSRPGTAYNLNTGSNFPGWYSDDNCIYLSHVVFTPSFANARPTSTYGWFSGMTILESITGMAYLETREVTNMAYMFESCRNLTSLDLSHFNTAKVTTMEWMFGYCES